jgi:hypothetical protein
MNTRPLTEKEAANLVCLNQAGCPSALLFLTATGLEKSILDATEPVRNLLKSAGVHDYASQAQGDAGKRIIPAFLLLDLNKAPIPLSLYRPVTKQGDPRLWFYGLKAHAQSNDICALFINNNTPILFNLTQSNLASDLARGTVTFASRFIAQLSQSTSTIAAELLANLRAIANRGFIKAIGQGDTAIGMSIEQALGISANSSRKPDYKGIELKAGRSTINGAKRTRTTLFACVPNWELSNAKSSLDILNRFGYQRGDQYKLYCSVSSTTANAQGLLFELDHAKRWLCETFTRGIPKEVAIWELEKLEQSLLQKHRETFWITAIPHLIKGVEHFELKTVQHTTNPNLPQLGRMLGDGSITMDHLIKRTPSGRAKEKGPLFKIWPETIPELFLGIPQIYSLNE